MILFCSSCRQAKYERDMHSEHECDICHIVKEVRKETAETKEQETRADPGKGIGGTKSDALAGQLTLI